MDPGLGIGGKRPTPRRRRELKSLSGDRSLNFRLYNGGGGGVGVQIPSLSGDCGAASLSASPHTPHQFPSILALELSIPQEFPSKSLGTSSPPPLSLSGGQETSQKEIELLLENSEAAPRLNRYPEPSLLLSSILRNPVDCSRSGSSVRGTFSPHPKQESWNGLPFPSPFATVEISVLPGKFGPLRQTAPDAGGTCVPGRRAEHCVWHLLTHMCILTLTLQAFKTPEHSRGFPLPCAFLRHLLLAPACPSPSLQGGK